jgi:hypothetical protein
MMVVMMMISMVMFIVVMVFMAFIMTMGMCVRMAMFTAIMFMLVAMNMIVLIFFTRPGNTDLVILAASACSAHNTKVYYLGTGYPVS